MRSLGNIVEYNLWGHKGFWRRIVVPLLLAVAWCWQTFQVCVLCSSSLSRLVLWMPRSVDFVEEIEISGRVLCSLWERVFYVRDEVFVYHVVVFIALLSDECGALMWFGGSLYSSEWFVDRFVQKMVRQHILDVLYKCDCTWAKPFGCIDN